MPKPKLINCKDCGAEISKRARTCPKCGRKNRSALRGVLGSVFVVIGIIAIVSSLGGGDSNAGTKKNATMSMQAFNSIETGMPYDEVVEIVGIEGELMSESDIGQGAQYKTQLFTWEGNGGLGSNANVTFQGGKVIAKAQLGLK